MSAYDNEQVGRKIRELRQARGYTQAQLGQLVDLTWQQVQRYESGSATLTLPRLVSFAQALKVPVSELIKGGPTTVDVSPETYFRNLGMTDEDIKTVMDYAKFLRTQRKTHSEKDKNES